MNPPALSVVVLQWNQQPLTESCVASIRAGSTTPYELIIVDNGSEPEAAAWAEDAADVSVLLETNEGFSSGMNHGLAVASGAHVAFVNNDTELPPGWDEMLLATLEETGAALAVPALSSGGNQSSVRSGPGTAIRAARPFVDLPSGVVYVMATDAIRALGGWREDYEVASAEDLDLLFTVWATGREVVIDERVFVEHVGSATAASQLPNKGSIWLRNRRQLVDTWGPMDEERFRARYGWQGEVDGDRLEMARIAAYWMGRYFEASDERGRLLAERSHAEHTGNTPDPAKPSRLLGRRKGS